MLIGSGWSSNLSLHQTWKLMTNLETSHLSLWFSRSALRTMDWHFSRCQDMLFWL